VIDCVVAPELQVLPVALLDVSTTLSPEQNVVGPLAVIVGVAGVGFTVTTTGAEVAVHAKIFERITLYVPLVRTVIDCVSSPLGFHWFPNGAELVSTTLSPAQNVVGPLAVIVGVGGTGLMVTVTGADVSDTQKPSTTTTV
jgi:hypothetical protein